MSLRAQFYLLISLPDYPYLPLCLPKLLLALVEQESGKVIILGICASFDPSFFVYDY
jgi:hypothetical protein